MAITPGELEQIRLQTEAVRQFSARVLRSARDLKQAAAQLESMVAEIVEQEESTTNAGQ